MDISEMDISQMKETVVFICQGSECLCCGKDMSNSDAIGVCWDCMSGNFECSNCLEQGVPFNLFVPYNEPGADETPLHKFSHWTEGLHSTAVAICGEEVPWDKLGQATAVLKNCPPCWKE